MSSEGSDHDFLSSGSHETDKQIVDGELENFDGKDVLTTRTDSCCDSDSFTRIVQAKANFRGSCDSELTFKRGEILEVIYDRDSHWWWCRLNDIEGYAPTNHLSLDNDSDDDASEFCWQDDAYFSRYSEVQFHLEMLLDKPRTHAYMKAIRQNQKALNGSVVLDVGCGSGILSMICARDTGVEHVYAVDASSMVNLASRVIKQNGLEEKITVIYGKVEGVTLPNDQKVDLIISEWMGTLLISECMIESVIVAREIFLKENGKVWPSAASLYLAPCTGDSSYESVSLDQWDRMYDFDFSPFKVEATHELLDRPLHKHIAQVGDLLATPTVILDFSLLTVVVSDLERTESSFSFLVNRKGIFHGFCTWFSVVFDPLNLGDDIVVLDTGPGHERTHWNHPLLLLNSPLSVDVGMVIKGKVILTRHPLYRRHVRLRLSGDLLSNENGSSTVIATFSKEFRCWQ